MATIFVRSVSSFAYSSRSSSPSSLTGMMRSVAPCASASISSGVIFARYGQGIYYVMAAMALSGGVIMWLARHRLTLQPHNAASGG